jgi:Lrp/AsnC family leucine-responsive transcriptional regulator
MIYNLLPKRKPQNEGDSIEMTKNQSQNGPETFGPSRTLDETGWAILRELQENARISFSELGRRVSLTPPAVADRVRRMEEAGLIRGYRAQVAMERVGYPISAFVRMRARGEQGCAVLGEFVKEVPEVVEAHRVTGEDSYIVKVVVRSVEHLQELIDRLMPYGETVTALVLSSPVIHRVLGEARETVTEDTSSVDRVTA